MNAVLCIRTGLKKIYLVLHLIMILLIFVRVWNYSIIHGRQNRRLEKVPASIANQELEMSCSGDPKNN
jgi:hypothetical protein